VLRQTSRQRKSKGISYIVSCELVISWAGDLRELSPPQAHPAPNQAQEPSQQNAQEEHASEIPLPRHWPCELSSRQYQPRYADEDGAHGNQLLQISRLDLREKPVEEEFLPRPLANATMMMMMMIPLTDVREVFAGSQAKRLTAQAASTTGSHIIASRTQSAAPTLP
jgi:hypothetical protein